MTNEEFVKDLVTSVLEENIILYKKFLSGEQGKKSEWSKIADILRCSGPDGEICFVAIIRSVIIDSISSVLGIIDGSSQIENQFRDFDLIDIDSKMKINGYLQELFFQNVEQLKDEKR